MKEKKAINIEIGLRLQKARERAGLTQECFSEMIGLGVKHISAIECGTVGVSLNTLRKVCTVLSIPADLLLFGEEESREDVEASVDTELQMLIVRLSRLPPNKRDAAKDIVSKILIALTMD